ncbi:MAG TPA: hypothetical protein VKM72_30875 [Thermoanaerobaculia bacterium]|nr:hypothetical protein [Thermoanaerobaculia bacterium]
MSHTFRFRAALALLLLLITSTSGWAVPDPAALVEVVVEDVTSAPTGLPEVDHLVTVERVLQGSVPGTSLIVRVPAAQGSSGLQAGEHAVVELTPAQDGSFHLLRVARETALPVTAAIAARLENRSHPAEASFGPIDDEDPQAGWSAAERIVTGLFEGNGFVSTLAALNLEGVGGSVTVLLKDAEGELVGDPAVLTLGPRILRLQPLSRMFPEVVSRRGPFTLQLVSNGILFAASAVLLEIESEDQIFIPATPIETGPSASAGQMFFPRVVRGQSPFDTFLASRLIAFNPAGEGRLLTLEFWERGQDNTAPRTAYRYVEPGRSLRVDDVLLDLFGVDEGIGALRIAWSGPAGPAPRIVSLMFAGPPDGQGKRFGALVDAVTEADAIHGRGIDAGAEQSVVTRTSLGILNLASTQTNLRLTLKDAAGSPLASTELGLKPRQHLERNVLGLFPGTGLFAGIGMTEGESRSIETEVVSGGPVLTYLAHIDATGDISYTPGRAQ